MTGTLIYEDDGWKLEDDSGEVVWSGDYPLTENDDFIVEAADKLGSPVFASVPYDRLDNREGSG